MIKVEVSKNRISILGHANYSDYGNDIVCAAVSSIVLTTINAIYSIDEESISVNEENNKLEIIINYHNEIVDKLINNMIRCLKEIEKQYEKNIKIREE